MAPAVDAGRQPRARLAFPFWGRVPLREGEEAAMHLVRAHYSSSFGAALGITVSPLQALETDVNHMVRNHHVFFQGKQLGS